MSAIPFSLRQAISEFCEPIAGPEIARSAEQQSLRYRSSGKSWILEAAGVAAYLTTRLPATYAAVSATLAQVRERAPAFSPASLLDFGTGPGTASWAAVETWPGIEAIAMRDQSEILLSVARQLAGNSTHRGFQNAETSVRRSFGDGEQHDLIIASYVIGEIAEPWVDAVVGELWDHCRGVLLIVEPGTPRGFHRVLGARDILIGEGAMISAPCPGHEFCPIIAPDWCHFAVRLPRSRDHMRAKSANVPYEDEKYSYVAAARPEVALLSPSPRIVAPVGSGKAGLRFRLCRDAGISELEIPRRDRIAYRSHVRKKWGDTI